MRGVTGHVAGNGLRAVDAGGGGASMVEQAADQHGHPITNHRAHCGGCYARQAVLRQQPVGAGRKIGQAVDERAIHIKTARRGGMMSS